ncbi:MAG TPA: 23S rRNA (uracil(1939)-C(5))-methyltransferase RlmD [Clostridia bacterium]|nr:23S rRNA (uracil(1939)-C(5))-methyltransferase RlmD [Clostridia bacterium]
MPELVKNNSYTMTVSDLGSEGEGIARKDGFVVLVPGALPGETVRAKIIKLTRSYAVGKLEEILDASPYRVEPPCAHFKACGGCTLQHMDYNEQLKYKTKHVRDCLERIGGITGFVMHDCIGMDKPFRYRNKTQFPAKEVDGAFSLGLYSPRSHRLVVMDDCLISDEKASQITRIVKDIFGSHKGIAYDEELHTGIIRHVVVRSNSLGELMIIFVINADTLPREKELISRLKRIPGVKSIVVNINKKPGNTILGDKYRVIWGDDYITDTVCGLKAAVSPASFMQVNRVQAEKLYNIALEAAALTGAETVIDAYCGTGLLTQLLARKARFAYGIEYVPEAIEDACKSARDNSTDNIEFIVGDCARVLPEISRKARPDVIVLDPPRKGCDTEVLAASGESGAGRIVYISCNAATLARDCKVLAGYGYAVKEVWAVDMFPHTGHVESIVLMTNSGLKGK